MGFRILAVSSRCKLEYSLNYLVCRKSEETTKVLLDEIDILIIQTTTVSLTTALISALVDKKVKVIFCNEKANPCCEIMPYYNNYSSYKKIKEQMDFSHDFKEELWRAIIKEKIHHQANLLKDINVDSYQLLLEYSNNVQRGDCTNREGHAAKVYFNALFGKNFSRGEDIAINKYLNYGYSIILSAINREVKICGYLTEVGIHHIGENNPFNISCDFMEPLRPFVDQIIYKEALSDETYKETMINILNRKITYQNSNMYLKNAIHLYVQDLFWCLRESSFEKLAFIKYEY